MTDEPELCTKISERVKMAGFLEKKGSMLWKKYWFVLEDKLLLYYKSQLEYINLSPCRGSLNMSLVSAVQPRRNSKEPIIHLVSRSHSFILKAKDRASQEKWMQSLLDSIGKQGMASLRFSLDDLPGQLKTMTLPRRLHHGGSLDAVWKQPVIPKNKMLDKVIGYEEEADENQNTDKYDVTDDERKSYTLDNRKMDSKLEKLRNAIGGRKSSAIFSNDPAAQKVRRESFLHKIFKKSPVKSEKDMTTADPEIDDPFYDTIDSVKTATATITAEPKPVFGTQMLLPEGTLTELKDRLKSKESLEKLSVNECEPPELPPRSFSNSMTTISTESTILKDTVEAVVHQTPSCISDSEESDLSGHYQTIKKPQENPVCEEVPKEEPEYQVINKSKKKKYRNLEIEDKHEVPPEVVLNEGGSNEEEPRTQDAKEIRREESSPEECSPPLPASEAAEELLQVELPQKEETLTDGFTEEIRLLENLEHDKKLECIIQENETPVTPEIQDDPERVTLDDLDKGLSDLNVLLMRLTEITTAPLSEREELKSWSGVERPEGDSKVILTRSNSEPDYDVPRSHVPIAPDNSIQHHRLEATEFFNKIDTSTSDSINSLEPDSLEDKMISN